MVWKWDINEHQGGTIKLLPPKTYHKDNLNINIPFGVGEQDNKYFTRGDECNSN